MVIKGCKSVVIIIYQLESGEVFKQSMDLKEGIDTMEFIT